MRNFTKIAKLHRMFFKRADEKTFPPGHFSPDANKPGPGNLDAQAAQATSRANAQNAADDRNMRANYNVTPTPGSASGHEVMTPKWNSVNSRSVRPDKPDPVSIYQNQGLTPKPSTPRAPRPLGDYFGPNDEYDTTDPVQAARSRAMQYDAQTAIASPFGRRVSEDGIVDIDTDHLDNSKGFVRNGFSNLPKRPVQFNRYPPVNNLQ
jgi:hypothetical protein